MNYKTNKKGVVELTSFALLTLIILVSSIAVFMYARDSLEYTVVKNDVVKVEDSFLGIDSLINKINVIKGSVDYMYFDFKTGLIVFKNNQIIYYTMEEYNSENDCIKNFCYDNSDGYKKITMTLSNNLNFNNQLTLDPGSYTLIFENLKSGDGISVSFEQNG